MTTPDAGWLDCGSVKVKLTGYVRHVTTPDLGWLDCGPTKEHLWVDQRVTPPGPFGEARFAKEFREQFRPVNEVRGEGAV